MNEHPNLLLLTRMYSGTVEGRALLKASLDDDFVLHAPLRDGPVGGDFAGWDGMQRHQNDFAERSGGTFRRTVLTCSADGTWGSVSQIAFATRDERTLEIPVCGVWRFTESGRLAENWELVGDAAAWASFWS